MHEGQVGFTIANALEGAYLSLKLCRMRVELGLKPLEPQASM